MHRRGLIRFKYSFSSILKSKKAFFPIFFFFAKYLSQSSQLNSQKIFFHFLLKSTYHDTLKRTSTPTKESL